MRKIAKNFSFLIPVIVCAFILVFMTGCEKKTEKNKAIANRFYKEIWNQGKLGVIDEIFASDFVHHEPIVGEVRGPGGFKKYVPILLTAFSDVQLTIEDQIAQGDKVVTRWTCTATHKGELIGIPPTSVQRGWYWVTHKGRWIV